MKCSATAQVIVTAAVTGGIIMGAVDAGTASAGAASPPDSVRSAPGGASATGSAAERTAGRARRARYVRQIIRTVNTARVHHGCAPLRFNKALRKAAQRHSADMAQRGFFDHINPDGAEPGDRLTAVGYPWTASGENIAAGQTTPSAVMRTWMRSPEHRDNILDCGFEELGVGVEFGAGGPWWTQTFGSRG
ncbi:CAP domain-containing protein [Streptomyces sp. NA02950]|uniref:CAP domain-containing protein n=1 Tax=Streptomyces sp. NA02950 TaxID=2742137 RepID=UPI0020CA9C8F|nr:CAP domain-containing protein [Streptomyces sp. NA02950]